MKYYFSILLILICTITYSQRREVDQTSLTAIPIDTLDANSTNTKIVMYSNGTWRYLVEDSHRMQLYKEFNNNWDTTQIFAYKDIKLTDLPDVVELHIVDSLDSFHPPIIGGRISSKYGPRRGRDHKGIDIATPLGIPLYSTFDGKVRFASYHTGGYGFLVIVRYKNGLESWYAHLCTMNVKVGDYVKSGQIIGYVGNTGRSYGNHLHYELRYRDQSFDPEFLIDFETGNLRYANFILEKSFLNINSRATEILEDEIEFNLSSADRFANAVDAESLKEAGNTKEIKAEIVQSKAVYHTIKSGDTLGALAVRYGTTVTNICRLNNISRNSVLRLRQRLRIR